MAKKEEKPAAKKEEKPAAKKEEKPAAKKEEKSDSWVKAEPWVVGLGRFAWLIGIAGGAVSIIWGIQLALFIWTIGTGIWMIASGAIAIVLALIFGLKFSKTCIDKDWKFVVDDVIKLGSLRIMKALFFGILISIFSTGWGGIGFIVPAILLIVLGPEKVVWKE